VADEPVLIAGATPLRELARRRLYYGTGACIWCSDIPNHAVPIDLDERMDIEQALLAAIRDLPFERRREVLDFATFLASRPQAAHASRPAGQCVGEFTVPDDFDAPLPDEVLEQFGA